MLKVGFIYNEPMCGEFELEGPAEDWEQEDIIQEIEYAYPEAVDIEITSIEEELPISIRKYGYNG